MSTGKKKVLLVGAGGMAADYAMVLDGLKVPYVVVGRGEESAKLFKEMTGHEVVCGGIESFLKETEECFDYAIIAVRITQLYGVSMQVLKKGIKNLLIEKPGGMSKEELIDIEEFAVSHGQSVFIAYNRRFYESVRTAKSLIDEEGGVTSFCFEFTEWGHIIKADTKITVAEKEIWFLANSSHVADVAFYMGGKPKDIYTSHGGKLDWHPVSSVFCGAGKSENGAHFSYQANWEAPGRWGVEVMTKKHRFIFRPLERLQIQEKGSINTTFVETDYSLDENFKPGLYRETMAFINGTDREVLCTIEEQINMMYFYERISGESI